MDAAYAFMDLYAKAKILVLAGGSNPALASIFIDSAQIAVTTRPMTSEEHRRADSAGYKVNEFKICKDGIAVVVNPLNPVKKLTRAQVVDIFTGKTMNWSAVGGKDWPVQVYIWGENSGTYSLFKDSILNNKGYSRKAWRFDATEDIIKNIAKEKGAISIISMSRLYRSWNPLVEDTRVTALAIGLDSKGKFVTPDEATVHSGDYPFVRYIYMYTAWEPKGLDAGFITFLTSSSGQKIIAANGFVPITVPVKYQQETR